MFVGESSGEEGSAEGEMEEMEKGEDSDIGEVLSQTHSTKNGKEAKIHSRCRY